MRCADVRGFNYDGSWGTTTRAKVVPVEEGKRYRITLSVSDDICAGQKVGKLSVRLTDGQVTEAHEVAVYGTVRASSE